MSHFKLESTKFPRVKMSPAIFCYSGMTVPAIPSPVSVSENSYLRLIDTQCSTMREVKQIHGSLIKTGLISDTIAASRVLAFCCASPSDMNYAYLLFTRINHKSPFVWNTIIRGFSRSSFPEMAISIFIDMLSSSSVKPQRLTYPSVFKAYASLGKARDGMQLHGRVIKEGLEDDSFIRNTMLHMYVTCGCFVEAWRIFIRMMDFDVVAWNSMITGLARCGLIEEAQKLFDEMPQRNEVSWISMISGFVRNDRFKDALELFREMQERNVRPDGFTMVSLLNACAYLGASEQGRWIHEYIVKNRFELNSIVVTALIDMYCKCGCIEEGLKVFESAPKKQLSCWNSMILGLANNGCEGRAMDLFSELVGSSGLEPDSVSFIGVLTACAHSGNVHKAGEFFRLMREKYLIEPSIKHYTCMVNVLGGAGFLEEAEAMIKNMPVEQDAVIWSCLLSACRKNGNVEMAERAAKCLEQLDPDETCGYVLMSKAYASHGLFEEAVEQRVLMKERQMEKEIGCSSIEVDLEVHEFVSCGKKHPKSPEIYSLLGVLNWDVSALESEVGYCSLLNNFVI